MNIKEFLLDNYIWILVVILLSIITVIGFLADKNRGGKTGKQKKQPAGNQPPQNVGPMNYQINQTQTPPQPVNYQNPSIMNNQNIMAQDMVPNQIPTNPINYGPMPNQPIPEPNPTPLTLNNINTMPDNNQFNNNNPLNQNNLTNPNINNPMPVEPINQFSSVNSEPMYQPLSEQTPTFQPLESQIMNSGNINGEINQPMPNPTQINVIPNPNQAFVQPVNNVNPVPPVATPIPNNNQLNQTLPVANQMNYGESFNQPSQNSFVEPNPYQMNNSINNNPTTIPSPEPNTIPNPITPPTPVNPQPINFVYGPQQQSNNNQNM